MTVPPSAPRDLRAKVQQLVREGRQVSAVVLAAGQSTRAGRLNKVLFNLHGKPLVAHVVDAALSSRVRSVFVVLGHEADRVRAALANRSVHYLLNGRYADGMASSLAVGVAAAEAKSAGIMVLLADMPWVRTDHIDALIEAFEGADGLRICAPTYRERRGHPVVWPARFAPDLVALTGDTGGRDLMDRYSASVLTVGVSDSGVLKDVDEPNDLIRGAESAAWQDHSAP